MSNVTHPPLSCQGWGKMKVYSLCQHCLPHLFFPPCSLLLRKEQFPCLSLRLVAQAPSSVLPYLNWYCRPIKGVWWSPLKSSLGAYPKDSLESLGPSWVWEWLLCDGASSGCAAPGRRGQSISLGGLHTVIEVTKLWLNELPGTSGLTRPSSFELYDMLCLFRKFKIKRIEI